ncbi:hypothetical protein A4A49_65454, partial [Nicotiana attenuata]
MSFKLITLKWYHDGVLVPGNFARYVEGCQILTLDVDVHLSLQHLLSFIELMNDTKLMEFKNVVELDICPMDRTDKLVNILTDKDILDICNELKDADTLDIYVPHVVPLNVVDTNEASKGVGGSNNGAFKNTVILEEEDSELACAPAPVP